MWSSYLMFFTFIPLICLQAIRRRYRKCPQHVPLYQAWACLELRSGDVLTAKRLISEALTRDKTNGEGWLVAAKIEEKMDNQGLVGLILRRGIECSPLDTELYRALADHEISRGRIDSVSVVVSCAILSCRYINLSHSCIFSIYNHPHSHLRHGNYSSKVLK